MLFEQKKNILIPIETSSREMDYKIMLAVRVAGPDARVYVGHYSVIDRLWKLGIRGGVYVGKNVLEHGVVWADVESGKGRDEHGFNINLKAFEGLMSSGFRMVHHHEEGGVHPGGRAQLEAALRRQLNPNYLPPGCRVLTWGKTQQEIYQQTIEGPVSIEVSGSPRFDLCMGRREYFHPDVKRIQADVGPYILVNCAFAWANYKNDLGVLVNKVLGSARKDKSAMLDRIRQWSHVNTSMSYMLREIARIAVEQPEIQWVLRPHPSESDKIYHTLFRFFDNVHVRRDKSVVPWILGAQGVLQMACTTSIESKMGGVPVAELCFPGEATYSIPVSSECAEPIHVGKELDGWIDDVWNDQARDYTCKPWSELAKSVIANVTPRSVDSFDIMANAADEVLDTIQIGDCRTLRELPTQALERLRVIAMRSALFSYGLLPRSKEHPYGKTVQEYVWSKFPGFCNADLQDRVGRAERIWNKQVRCRVFSPYLASLDSVSQPTNAC